MITTETEARRQICEIGHRLWTRGLVAAHDGNISVRLENDRILCTSSGVSKGFMDPSSLVLVDYEGQPVAGNQLPSSELKMHLEIYKCRPDVDAVVHAHPPHGTAYALKGIGLPHGVMPEIDMLLGETPVVPYLTPGTQEFALAVADAAKAGANVLVLQRHGITTVGEDLISAWFRMESMDHCCKILMLEATMKVRQK